MTVETKHLIEIGDIISLEFACNKCEAKLLHPIEGFSRVPSECPNCREQLVERLGPDSVAIEDAVKAIRRLKDRSLPVKLRLEIRNLGDEKQ